MRRRKGLPNYGTLHPRAEKIEAARSRGLMYKARTDLVLLTITLYDSRPDPGLFAQF
jgi:hypothetical protein